MRLSGIRIYNLGDGYEERGYYWSWEVFAGEGFAE